MRFAENVFWASLAEHDFYVWTTDESEAYIWLTRFKNWSASVQCGEYTSAGYGFDSMDEARTWCVERITQYLDEDEGSRP